ncbi:lipid II-degrading bacteriocin [Pseudomonas sp. R1-18]|uniref:lipid II-degrading bacteriocin n=1 Tax=Pseudomonas sp. R1-18 TaxID=1632772 RepID=UPI003DAA0FB6
MAIELPATVIYGNAPTYTFDGNWDSAFDSTPAYVREIYGIPLAAEAYVMNGPAVWAAAAEGDGHKLMEEVCKGLSGQSLLMLKDQFALHCYGANYVGAGGVAHGKYTVDGQSLQGAYGQFILANLYTNAWRDAFKEHPIDLYGPFMPFSAVGYWIFGEGRERNIHVGSLNLAFDASEVQPIQAILSNSANGPGVYPLANEPFSINTFKHPSDLPVALTVGRVSGNITGSLTVNPDGTYSFSGSYTLNDDKFDADPNKRPWLQEALTTFLRGMGDVFGHTDYYIRFQGSQELTLTGTR